MENIRQGPPNGLFCLEVDEEGVYFVWLEAGPPDAAQEESVMLYMERKRVQAADIRAVRTILASGERRFLIAPPQKLKPLDEDFQISVDEKKMEAKLRLILPDAAGKRLSPEDVLSRLRAKEKITFGVSEEAVRGLLAERDYEKEILVAQGRAPIHGEQGTIRYHFSTEHSLSPKELENGKVDYRELDLFDNCVPGQLLATITLATEGIEGFTVFGKPLRASSGKRIKPPLGKGTRLSEDGKGIYAMVAGRVDLINKKIVVSENYEIAEDADMSVGNINFSGDVTIRGSVISGITVRAGGNIEVHGIVEAAHLKAEGNVVLHRGMQGMNKGTIRAGGMVVAKFIERASIFCQGSITTDALIHCDVSCRAAVIAAGKRGVLFGGQITSPTEVRAQTLGSTFDAKTNVTIGLSQAHMDEWTRMAIQRDDLEQQIEKEVLLYEQIQKDGNMPMQRRGEMMAQVAESRVEHKKEFDALNAQMEMLGDLMISAQRGKVHVSAKVHPGTRLSIGGMQYLVRDTMEHVTFKCRDGEIKAVPYEFIAGD